MTMDSVSEIRLSEVIPVLGGKIRQLAEILAGDDIVIRVTQGLRTWEQQDALYSVGRELIGGIWVVVDRAKVVTNAAGGHSWHNVGCAVDVCPSSQPEGQPFTADWNVAHPDWQRIVNEGVLLGLDSGSQWRTFKDWPHLQYTGPFPEGAPTDEVRQLFTTGSFKAVWEAVTSGVP